MKTNWVHKLTLTVSCLAATGLLSGAASAQKALGINDHIIWRTNADQDVAFAKYAESNTKFLRVGADWNVLEQTKGTYTDRYLSRLDYFFQKCATANIRVLLTPSYAPDWAVAAETKNQGGWAPDADKAEDFADFCEFLLRRYTTPAYTNRLGQHTLEAIELWNEPDLADAFFKPYNRYAANGATVYANMVVAAGGRIKKVRSTLGADDVRILAPVVSQVHGVCWAPAGQTTWMDAFYAVPNVTANYDVFSWHTYWESSGTTWLPPELPLSWNPANQRQAVLGKLIAPEANEIWVKMVAHGDNLKPNWCTEIGGASKSDTSAHKESMLSFAEQQTHLTDAINTLQAGHVTNLNRIYWYEIFDEPHAVKSQAIYGLLALNDGNPIVYNGGISLEKATFTPKPAYAVYKDAPKEFTGTTPSATQSKPSVLPTANTAKPVPAISSAPAPAKTTAVTNTAPPVTASKPVVALSNDFNTGDSTAWTATPGTWATVAGQYSNPHNASVGISTIGDASWQNYSAQAKMKFSDPWKSAGLIARYNGSEGYYLRVGVNATTQSHTIQLLKGSTVVSTAPISNAYDFKTFHTVKISVKNEAGGTRVLGFIDNTQHLDYLDTEPTYPSGKFALRAEKYSGTITVDDVLITPN